MQTAIVIGGQLEVASDLLTAQKFQRVKLCKLQS